MIKIRLNTKQLKEAIKELPSREQIKLVRELQRDTWDKRFKQLLARIDARRKKYKITDEEISEEIEKARDEFYAKRGN